MQHLRLRNREYGESRVLPTYGTTNTYSSASDSASASCSQLGYSASAPPTATALSESLLTMAKRNFLSSPIVLQVSSSPTSAPLHSAG